MSDLKIQFAELKEAISGLAKQLELLSGEQPRYHLDFLVTIDDSYIEATMMSRTDDCSCKTCKLEQKIRSYQLAVGRAEKHKLRLSREIENRQSINSTLEVDQTGIEEE
jgi:hypothetical protein